MKALWHISILLAVSPAGAQSFESWSAKAEKAQTRGDTEQAVEYWSNALRLWRNSNGASRRAKALAARAALYEKTGKTEAALADLRAAIALAPKNPTLFDRRGQLYLYQDKLAEAISDFYAATKLDLNFGAAYLHRGQAYALQGDEKFAKEDFRTACRLGKKEACPLAKNPFAPAPSSNPQRTPGARAPSQAPPIDFQACLAAIDACGEGGDGISVCVKKARVCEKFPGKGCCPRECVRQFQRRASPDKSDAELFRAIFSVKNRCLHPQ